MATTNCHHRFQIRCSAGRPGSMSHRFDDLKASFSSSFKPLLLRELPQLAIPMRIDVSKTLKNASVRLLDALVGLVFEFVDQPLLPSQSNKVPVEEIGEAVLVTCIQGTIPDDFPEGVYIRNGPNPLFGALKATKSMMGRSSYSWVEGEGMVHALYFSKETSNGGGWSIFYNNKYIQTETLKIERNIKKPAFLPAVEGHPAAIMSAHLLNNLRFGEINKHISNTNVFEHSGKFYSIAENHMPQEIDIFTLETLGNWELMDKDWRRALTSHPKKARDSQELVVVGVEVQKPYLQLGVISADGKKLVHKVDLKVKRCTLCHEIGITQRYNVIMDFPPTIDLKRLQRGGPLVKFDRKEYARIGVMPRYGDADTILWFEVETCSVFHIINCFEDGDDVVVWACRARGSIVPGPDFGLNKTEWFSRGLKHINSRKRNDEDDMNSLSQDAALFYRPHEWRLNVINGEVKERNLTNGEFAMDFPVINESCIGVKNRFGYAQLIDSVKSSTAAMAKFGGLAKLYFEEIEPGFSKGKKQTHEFVKVEYHMFPENTYCSGCAFVPKVGGLEEDDGWIIAFVHNENTNESQVHVVDAKNFSSDPVTRITLATRVPYGFHGTFFPVRSGRPLRINGCG